MASGLALYATEPNKLNPINSNIYSPFVQKRYRELRNIINQVLRFRDMLSQLFEGVSYGSIGMWAMAGFATGFVAKKIGKYLMIAAGLYVASLLYLQDHGFITINRSLGSLFGGIVSAASSRADAVWAAATALPVVGAFGAGAYVGVASG